MFGFSRFRNTLSDDERKIVGRLLDGDTEFLAALRSQLVPPFFQRIERRTPTSKPKIYRTPPNEYHIDIVYDDCLSEEFSAGTALAMRIDDLVVVDRRLSGNITVEGRVSRGILTNIVFRADVPVRWPKHLRADDWWYKGKNGDRVNSRDDLGSLQCFVSRPTLADLPDGWFREFLRGEFDQDAGVTLRQPASKGAVLDLETSIGTTLPSDYSEFLFSTDGALLWGEVVFGCNEVYALDEDDFGHGKVVFSQAADGSLFAFDMSEYGGGREYPVVLFDHDSQETEVVATSFMEWLASVVKRSRTNP